MYKFKLSKPLSASSLVWALLVTAVVLLIASGANAQEEMATSSIPAVPPIEEMPPIPDARNMTATATATLTTTTSLPMPPVPAVDTRSQRAAALEERLSDIQERRAAIEAKRTALQSASSTRRALLPEAAKQRALNGMARVGSVLSTSISKSRDFATRLEARADELGANNAATLIDQAKAQLDLAEQALRDLDVNAEYALTSAQPRTDWQDVREQFGVVRQALREAHLLLRSAASEMRGSIAAEALPVQPATSVNPEQ